jgi:peptidyl-prolyl cis-trans isomerase B (cyclophilin B)
VREIVAGKVALVAGLAVLAGCGESGSQFEGPRVRLYTSRGEIDLGLYEELAPETTENFLAYVEKGFYDGLIFHYGDGSFSANAGDPACTADAASTCRGDGGPGYDVVEEVPGTFDEGTVGMANGSQFFIALTKSEQFQGYTPLGRIVSGLDVAQQVTAGTEIQTVEILEQ